MQRTFIKITSEKLDLHECYGFVEDASCGGISAFIGTVRNDTQGKEVLQLEFSTYKPMAIKEMQKIAALALEKFDTASSKHRKAAFEACEFAIDTLKETVPIWKKEYFSDGEVWVNAHP
jgi:molybdopterin synthase catalytic subunit